MKCCGNCEYRRQSKLKIQFNEIPITAYCDNKNSPCYDKYIWDTDCCAEWEGAREKWMYLNFASGCTNT